jgi:hypothetical protein
VNTNPKTEHLRPWKPGQESPNPQGRPVKFVTTLKRQGLKQSEVNSIILVMLAMGENELNTIIETETATILELTIARALLNGAKKGSLYAMESLLNRSVGMPKVQQEVNIEQRNVNITLELT